MVKREEINIELYGKSSEHILSSNVKSSKLAVLFPGAGSNTRAPYFYYCRYYFLRDGYDVLALSYKNIADSGDSFSEQMRKISHSIDEAIKVSHARKPYKEIVFVSRSIGNIIAERTRTNYKYNDIISVYASPTSQAISEIKDYPGLVITSTEDETLKDGDLDRIKALRDHEVIVFDNADHRIECFETLKTIEYCGKAIERTMQYIKKKSINNS
jgi:alpha/beta superfamily hydrolase